MLGFCEEGQIKHVVDKVFAFEELKVASIYLFKGGNLVKLLLKSLDLPANRRL